MMEKKTSACGLRLAATAIGAAASLAGAANAADVPRAPSKPAPVAFMQACPEFGPMFIRIPGSNTCLQISFDLVAESKINLAKRDFHIETTRVADNPVAFYDLTPIARSVDRIGTRVDPRIGFITVTSLGNDILLSNVTFRVANTLTAADARSTVTPTGETLHVDQAWVKYGGITAGRHGSFFDFTPGYTYSGGYASNRTLNLFAYTQNFGKIGSLSLAVEDGIERRVQDGVWASYAGQALPDIVARARLTPSWGTFHAAFAYHQLRDSSAGSDTGFAANAGMELRQKWSDLFGVTAGETYGRFLLSGTYARGALDYLGMPRFATDYVRDIGDRLDRTSGTSFVASYEHVWRPNFKTTLAFSAYQAQTEVTSFDWKTRGILAQAGAEYQPRPGLMVGIEGNYFRDMVRGTYFGVPAARDTANIVTGFLYVRRRI